MSKINILNSADFKAELEKKDELVLVDFFATWCGPCQMLAPILEEVSDEVAGQATVKKLDIDNSREIAMENMVMSVPTMILYKDGKEVERIIGLRQKNQIVETIKKHA